MLASKMNNKKQLQFTIHKTNPAEWADRSSRWILVKHIADWDGPGGIALSGHRSLWCAVRAWIDRTLFGWRWIELAHKSDLQSFARPTGNSSDPLTIGE
jgi:hypothetical protein